MAEMNRWLRWTCCSIAALGAVATSAAAQTRYAVLVGVDKYDAYDSTAYRTRAASPFRGALRARGDFVRGRVTNLGGAVGDATAMRQALMARYGFASANITMLADGAATREAILGTIDALRARVHRGDIVVFYYAGHGSQRVNRLNGQAMALDQTIVPADANAGVFDIRDKELARAFSPIAEAGATLTLIFDSCHSGTITRGEQVATRARWAAIDSSDARDSLPVPRLADVAATLSAALDQQTAAERRGDDNLWHGAFTWSLVRALMSGSPNAPAAQLFAQAKAIMQADQPQQEPVFDGPERRRNSALFDGGPSNLSGRTILAATGVVNARVALQGGMALGIRVGTILKQSDDQRRVRVVRTEGLSGAEAEPMSGDLAGVSAGTLFEVEKWGSGDEPMLRVWLPKPLSALAMERLSTLTSALRSDETIRLVSDPLSPDGEGAWVMRWQDDAWEVTGAPSPVLALVSRRLPATADAAQVRRALGASATRPQRLFISVPPTAALASAMRWDGAAGGVRVVSNAADAHYILSGRSASDGGLSYAWTMPNRSDSASTTMPARTRWTTAGGKDGADSLVALASSLARLRGWLTLTSPPATVGTGFPYRLGFRQTDGSALVAADMLMRSQADGSPVRYEPLLVLDTAEAQRTPVTRWFAYVTVIDRDGASSVICPTRRSTTDNVVPPQLGAEWPAEVRLDGCPFRVSAPFGADTWLLVASRESIPRDAFEASAVRGGESATRGAGAANPLARMLHGRSALTRGAAPEPVDADWFLMRRVMRSVDKF